MIGPVFAPAPRFAGRYWFDTEFRDGPDQADFISIGIVAEDGREFYAVSNAFDTSKARAHDWIRNNVLKKLGRKGQPARRQTPGQIRDGIARFIGQDKKPEFWAYNNAYDVFMLCRLFGGMQAMRARFDSVDFFDVKQLRREVGDPDLPPKGPDEHNALADARWDKHVWEFLMRRKAQPASPAG